MTIFSWGYVLAVTLVILIYRWIGPKLRVPFLAFASLTAVILQNSPIPILGPVFAIITLGLLLVGWLLARWIDRRSEPASRKRMLVLGIVLTLLPLFFFRYLFGEMAVNRVFLMATERFGAGAGSILAPLGISYFTFRILCYQIEVYRKNIQPIPAADYIAYITFLPTMMAGPIERVGAFVSQIRSGHTADTSDVAEGLHRIALGLFKKLVLGAFFYQLSAPMLSLPANDMEFAWELSRFSPTLLWFSFYMNFLYIYLDFSGYSDIAIGTSRLFGIRILENFNYPILATNIAEFWQRFHISLTGWIRDYVYFPLGGSRARFRRAAFNTVLMMVLVGIWHGAARHYAVFGVYMGLCLVVFRQWRRFKQNLFPDRVPAWWGKLIGWALTMTCYALGLVFFNFSTAQALRILAIMFGLG